MMHTLAESQMRLAVGAMQVEFGGVVELFRVSVGRSKSNMNHRSFGDFHSRIS